MSLRPANFQHTTPKRGHVSKQLYAAVVQKSGAVSLLLGDGGESVAEVSAAMLELGAQPETIAALQRVTSPTAKTMERTKKSYGRIRPLFEIDASTRVVKVAHAQRR